MNDGTNVAPFVPSLFVDEYHIEHLDEVAALGELLRSVDMLAGLARSLIPAAQRLSRSPVEKGNRGLKRKEPGVAPGSGACDALPTPG
jgi:hypothetical protein